MSLKQPKYPEGLAPPKIAVVPRAEDQGGTGSVRRRSSPPDVELCQIYLEAGTPLAEAALSKRNPRLASQVAVGDVLRDPQMRVEPSDVHPDGLSPTQILTISDLRRDDRGDVSSVGVWVWSHGEETAHWMAYGVIWWEQMVARADVLALTPMVQLRVVENNVTRSPNSHPTRRISDIS